MLIRIDNKKLPNANSNPTLHNYNNLKCKHINYLSLFHKLDPKAVICSNSEIQFLITTLYCYNENSLRIQYTPPAHLNNLEILTLPTVQALTSIFRDVTVLTDSERILQFYLKGLTDECEEVFSSLWNTLAIDKSIKNCFRGRNSLDLISPMNAPITYELTGDSNPLDMIKISSDIISNSFLSFLLTQCIRNNSLLIMPIKGWQADEIENCEYLNMLPHIFKNVWFCGFGDKWVSDSIIVYQPFQNIISQFTHLYRSGSNNIE
ncbi:hypothetical protein CLHUN_27910 [Ruminiclostridium hungatei]|uniref:Uncharacterized protein n=1 Tax=Ruminiclostridium hungatei TaxID=48256 RepID=A0A1V4SHL6_RUMHU|nr:hypothetical protein [Ruminiclostridium hungatei]OPX43243.1 hypothetical protein CLHUN_27910 [Ruminiclostridium hungatei]